MSESDDEDSDESDDSDDRNDHIAASASSSAVHGTGAQARVLRRGHREHLRKRHKKVERAVGRILRACLVERQVQVARLP